MATTSAATSSAAATAASVTAATTKAGTTNEASDRFLKLLVTQMQNQDPLNPMDNAQVTSQMAQIQTVTGVEKLNTTMTDLGANLTQMQMLQGAGLVGHNVWLEGNQLTVNDQGVASGGFDLASSAGAVHIDILNKAGKVIDSIDQSAVAAGRQGFTWTAPSDIDTTGLSFKVTATTGKTAVGSTSLMQDRVNAVSTQNGALTLELANKGSVAYSTVKAVS
ncbi:flagellar hook capping FlgD N-terminal domain-containing protein [Aquabacterium sp.]|jgi:flagellar basal-body rod modification protein FlgD|uniref:flagellar hook assembly protein FlgD n=1 Tax=Aquabacterium sp. TaxID=1872578 RepID=UPI0025C33683|nr:flagellar hook capping FlgD N-terminal domain-containing protein [Aquabacterium sp.]